MNNYNEKEFTIILAIYYFEKEKLNDKTIKKLTQLYNDFFDVDVSSQTLSYNISLFKSIDPTFNVDRNKKDNELFKLWQYYIVEDRIKDLKALYHNFKSFNKNFFIKVDESDFVNYINENFIEIKNIKIVDEPKLLYEECDYIYDKNKRDPNVAFNALKAANYECEYNNDHKSFIRKNTNLRYTEAHHLIPLKYQYLFNVNLDVEANIVSLCSNCHNNLHYGNDYKLILEKLYKNRIARLNKCGIFITFDELLKMYE